MKLLTQNIGDITGSAGGSDLLSSLFGGASGEDTGTSLDSLMDSLGSMTDMLQGDMAGVDMSSLTDMLGGDSADLYSNLMDELNGMSEDELQAMLAEA
jgi:hypothetical protein